MTFEKMIEERDKLILISKEISMYPEENIDKIDKNLLEKLTDAVEALCKYARMNSDDNTVDQVLNLLKDNAKVYSFVKEKTNVLLQPYNDTKFLRCMNSEDCIKCLDVIFNRLILQSDIVDNINEQTNLSKDEILRSEKLLNTVMRLAIDKNATDLKVIRMLTEKFGLEEQVSAHIAKLFHDNKHDLQMVAMFRRISYVEDILEQIEQIFKNIADSIEDSE